MALRALVFRVTAAGFTVTTWSPLAMDQVAVLPPTSPSHHWWLESGVKVAVYPVPALIWGSTETVILLLS